MKITKILVTMLAAFSLLVSCVSREQGNKVKLSEAQKTEYLQSIYEVGDSEHNSMDGTNRQNLVSDAVIVTNDSTVGVNMTIQFLGEALDITYMETIFYPIGGQCVHRYALPVNEKASILFHEDGSVFAVLGDFTTIDIAPDASSDIVKTAVEPVISQWLDTSKYEYVDVKQASNDGSFGYYEFQYYNIAHGYRTDWAQVVVDDTGEIGCVWIKNISVNEEVLSSIDTALEEALLEAKLRDIFDTDVTSLLDYELKLSKRIMEYNNELCVRFLVSVSYLGNWDGVELESKDTCEILIPIRLLTTE